MGDERVRYDSSELRAEVKVDARTAEREEEHALAGRRERIRQDEEAQNGGIWRKGEKVRERVLNEKRGGGERETRTHIHTQREEDGERSHREELCKHSLVGVIIASFRTHTQGRRRRPAGTSMSPPHPYTSYPAILASPPPWYPPLQIPWLTSLLQLWSSGFVFEFPTPYPLFLNMDLATL